MGSRTLLHDWPTLQENVAPLLARVQHDRGEVRAWSIDDRFDDAVAVAAAHCVVHGGGCSCLKVFASGPPGSAQLSFTLSEIRAIPTGIRRQLFERRPGGWTPQGPVSDRVVLGRPARPVDLITVTEASVLAEQLPLALLRQGGHLLSVEPVPPRQVPAGVRAVGRSRRLFQKRSGRTCDPGADLESEPEGTDESGVTLAERVRQSDLVQSHTNLARAIARRFAGHGEPRDDLDQVALLALVKAASRFDPGRDVSFSTFATSTILGELKRHFRDKTWMMRVPRPLQETYLAVKDAREALTHELRASPTIAQIADRLRISPESVLDAMEAGDNYWPESLSAGMEEGEPARDVPVHEPGYERALQHMELVNAWPRLTERERLLLSRLFLQGWTQRQAAEELGVSQMQVSRLMAAALAKLRNWAR